MESAFISLDGNNDWVEIAHLDFTSEFTHRTIAMWIKPDNKAGTHTIWEEGGTVNGFCLQIRENKLEARAKQENSHKVDLATPFSSKEWKHVALRPLISGYTPCTM